MPKPLSAALACLLPLCLVLPVAADAATRVPRDGIVIDIGGGPIVGDIVIHDDTLNELLAGLGVLDVSDSSEVRSGIRGFDMAGMLTGFRHFPGSSETFVYPASIGLGCTGPGTGACVLFQDVLARLQQDLDAGLHVPDLMPVGQAVAAEMWSLGDFVITLPAAPRLLLKDNDTDLAHLCRLIEPLSVEALVADGLQLACTQPDETWQLSDQPQPAPNGNGWQAVNAGFRLEEGGPVFLPPRIIHLAAEDPVPVTLEGLLEVYGLSDDNRLIARPAEGDKPVLAVFDGEGISSTTVLPDSWTVTVDGGSYDIPFLGYLPLAINTSRIVLRVNGYDTENIGCTGAACEAPLPVEMLLERTGDLFYCLLSENCSTAYPLLRTNNTVTIDEAGNWLPAVNASGSARALLGNDNVLVVNDRRLASAEPFLVDLANGAGKIWLLDAMPAAGWSDFVIESRRTDGLMAGYAVAPGDDPEMLEISAVVLAPAGFVDAGGDDGDSDDGGSFWLWPLLILGVRRRYR